MKTIVITGANTGIGKEAALQLAQKGERVLMINRDSAKSHGCPGGNQAAQWQ
jgi:NAD(P)-dependent dehydrogenase (short-subunit alcohol dehydrogenase family)